MRKRQYRARVWLNEKEYDLFMKNVEKSGLTKEAYLRKLINGHLIIESPPLQYHKLIRQIIAIGNNLNQIALRLNSLSAFDARTYAEKYEDLMNLILIIQQEIENPKHVRGQKAEVE